MSKFPFVIAAVLAVIALGIFTYTSEALSYMGTDAETCANCHVMNDAYENWFHGPHEKVAECVDCHLPHENPVAYYIEKGRTGMHDVFVFTTGQTPDTIRAKPETKDIIQNNCIRCHETAVQNMLESAQPMDRYCWACHRDVAHSQRGIDLSPYQNAELYPAK